MTRAQDSASLKCLQHRSATQAYATTINLLRRVAPFSNYRFGTISTVLLSQIRRKHYVLTYAIPEEKPVGYCGWALCEERIAKAWVEDGYVPSHEECMAGDCCVVATFYGASPAVTRFQARYVRNAYPNVKVYGRRDYGERLRPMQVRNVIGAI